MSEGWLACEVSDGMFSDERAVTYGDTSVFVPADDVRQDVVKITYFTDQGGVFAILPTAERTIIPINEADLRGQ